MVIWTEELVQLVSTFSVQTSGMISPDHMSPQQAEQAQQACQNAHWGGVDTKVPANLVDPLQLLQGILRWTATFLLSPRPGFMIAEAKEDLVESSSQGGHHLNIGPKHAKTPKPKIDDHRDVF